MAFGGYHVGGEKRMTAAPLADVPQLVVPGCVDFIVFGPIYFTPSKASYGAPQGLERLQKVVDKISLPVYAIGGINQTNIADVKQLGVRGIALISAILGADDPKNATAKILALLRR
jgi:thiamine-phosphate pyrophosphorylase